MQNMNQPLKTAILGAGALGSVVGALLVRAGRKVELWDTNADHLYCIQRNGLRLDSPLGSEVLRIAALHPQEATVTPDLIILLTKTLHTEQALAIVRRHIDAGAHVLTLQNGLGNAERVATQVPIDRVHYGCTMMPGSFIAPGHVATPGIGEAAFKSMTENGRAFAERIALKSESIVLDLSDAADVVVWQKAAFNCAINAILALSGGTVGSLAISKGGRDLAYAVSGEVVALANAKGIPVEREIVGEQIEMALAHHRAHKPSMLQDIEAGRQTEIESLCGEVSRQARTMGIATPMNDTLAVLVRLKTTAAGA